jgi:hypothetical protein
MTRQRILRPRAAWASTLACAFLLAHLALLLHTWSPAAHVDGDPCEICLIGTGHGHALAAAPAALPPPVHAVFLPVTFRNSCHAPACRVYAARAPPVLSPTV